MANILESFGLRKNVCFGSSHGNSCIPWKCLLPRYKSLRFYLIEKQIFGAKEGFIIFQNEYLNVIVVILTFAKRQNLGEFIGTEKSNHAFLRKRKAIISCSLS